MKLRTLASGLALTLLAACATHDSGNARTTLSRSAAIRAAWKAPWPSGYQKSAYRFAGTAMYHEPEDQWGVVFEYDSERHVVGSQFSVWIDDDTGRLVRHSFNRGY